MMVWGIGTLRDVTCVRIVDSLYLEPESRSLPVTSSMVKVPSGASAARAQAAASTSSRAVMGAGYDAAPTPATR